MNLEGADGEPGNQATMFAFHHDARQTSQTFLIHWEEGFAIQL